MSLSERAKQFIGKLNRDYQFVSSEEETRDYLAKQEISSSYEQFVKYQTTYSGYELTIDKNPKESFSCRLFSKKQIRRNEELDIIKVGDRIIQNCGEHRTAQFGFFLTDKGEFCTLNDEDLPNVLRSSFDKFVEEYAFRNEISHWDCNPYYFEVLRPDDLKRFMGNKFSIIEDCSDSLATWWTNDQVAAVKGVWFDNQGFYFHVYGKTRQLCDDLIKELKRENILKNNRI